MTRPTSKKLSDTVPETPEARQRRQQQVTASQLATSQPLPQANRAASLLTPLALIAVLAVVAGALVWVLFYPRQQTTYGLVSSIQGDEIAVETLDGPLERFALDAETVYPRELTPGDPIVVHYRELDGSKVAIEISERTSEISGPGADPSSAEPLPP